MPVGLPIKSGFFLFNGESATHVSAVASVGYNIWYWNEIPFPYGPGVAAAFQSELSYSAVGFMK